jgi:hypothetical protein
VNRTQDQFDRDLDAADRLDSLLDGLTGTATAGYHGLTHRRDIPCNSEQANGERQGSDDSPRPDSPTS